MPPSFVGTLLSSPSVAGQFDEGIKTLQDYIATAFAKGGLKRGGDAWMRLAVAEHGLKNTQAAVAALQKAVGFDETRKQAGEWLRHLSGQVAAGQQQQAPAEKAAT